MATINSWSNTVTSAGSITLSTTNGAILMNSGTGTISVSNDASNTSINIGTGAAVKNLTIGSTNSTSSTSIRFGESPSQTLNNYSSGTFTPAINFNGASVGITYDTQIGKYFRIGSMVFVSVIITLTSKGSSTGNLGMSGIPFSSANDSRFNLFSSTCINITFGVGRTMFFPFTNPNTSTILFQGRGSAVASQTITNTQMADNSSFTMSGFYWTS